MGRKSHELAEWDYPPAAWLDETERMAAVADRLPAVLNGDDQPRDNTERLALAQMCYDSKRTAVATRFYAEALEADPKLGDSRSTGPRYKAACAAALAGAGRGKDVPAPDDDAKSGLRAQALGWLKAELIAWDEVVKTGSGPLKAEVGPTLRHWKEDQDLDGVRKPNELAKLPEGEREGWLAFWRDVDALIKQAG